jgi:RecJ-like exonuclease
MKPERLYAVLYSMNEQPIDDSDLTPASPTDPASTQQPDATLCPACTGAGAVPSGETCPVCAGTGKAVGRSGGG